MQIASIHVYRALFDAPIMNVVIPPKRGQPLHNGPNTCPLFRGSTVFIITTVYVSKTAYCLIQILHEVGALEITGGRINKTGEEVLIATFPTPDTAIKALQMHNMPFTLSIPRSNHAKFILSLLHNVSVQ